MQSEDISSATEAAAAASSLGNGNEGVRPETTMARKRRKWNIGLFLLLLVVLLWVSSSFMINAIFEDDSYRKPYLVTYLSTATFSFYLLKPYFDGSLTFANDKHKNVYRRANSDEHEAVALEVESDVPSASDSQNDSRKSTSAPPASDDHLPASEEEEEEEPPEMLTVRETAKLSLQFCILWFTANYFANACLSYTTVASGTILACTSSFFTLLIGSLFGVERFSRRKVLAIAASLTGIVLISTQDSASEDESNPLSTTSIVVGDLMSLASAAIYGLYTTLLKLKIGDESRINMQIFFGFVGAWNTVLLWPLIIFNHFSGAETLEMPPTSFVWLVLFANSLVTFFSDYLWIVTILLTSPLVVTMGLSGTIPLAVVGDVAFNGVHVSLWYLLGRDEEKEHHIVEE
ncbi:hypothetical protein BZA70DRAFT_285309 [Myxozyma melibiosi]|uniref:EamA domain-containing protein n=1 Tax=Myxozyma melibiosi TaxID=54550 RepID=A0ABR1EY49_9ASCO